MQSVRNIANLISDSSDDRSRSLSTSLSRAHSNDSYYRACAYTGWFSVPIQKIKLYGSKVACSRVLAPLGRGASSCKPPSITIGLVDPNMTQSSPGKRSNNLLSVKILEIMLNF